MSPDKDAQLRADYPLVFQKPLLDGGTACGDGWHGLLLVLSRDLERLIGELPEESRSAYHAAQVKEKFGGLRFYMSRTTDEMREAIAQAERASFCVCDVCGEPGRVHIISMLVATRCDEHAKQRHWP